MDTVPPFLRLQVLAYTMQIPYAKAKTAGIRDYDSIWIHYEKDGQLYEIVRPWLKPNTGPNESILDRVNKTKEENKVTFKETKFLPVLIPEAKKKTIRINLPDKGKETQEELNQYAAIFFSEFCDGKSSVDTAKYLKYDSKTGKQIVEIN